LQLWQSGRIAARRAYLGHVEKLACIGQQSSRLSLPVDHRPVVALDEDDGRPKSRQSGRVQKLELAIFDVNQKDDVGDRVGRCCAPRPGGAGIRAFAELPTSLAAHDIPL